MSEFWYLDLLRAVKNYDDANQSDLPLGLLDSIREATAAAPSPAVTAPTDERMYEISPLERSGPVPAVVVAQPTLPEAKSTPTDEKRP